MNKSNNNPNEHFFNDFINEMTAANLQSQGNMSIIEFANRIIFNNDPDFQLFPTQKAILKSFYKEPLTQQEQDILVDWVKEERSTWVHDRKYISLVLEAGRRASKALDLNTLIETPEGTKKFRNIKKGDYVFGVKGTPVKVLEETEIFHNHNIYELTFDDGSKVKCDEGHLWKTKDNASKKIGNSTIKTTKEIVNSLFIKRKDGTLEPNHSIELAKPLKYSKQSLLIHPWVLGVWLGNGTSRKGEITASKEDIYFIMNKFNKLGYYVTGESSNDYTYKFYSERLNKELQQLNLLKNKHIPTKYLYSSLAQRIHLLKGLMDTDGTVSKKGKTTFINTNFNLTESVFKLAVSLGAYATRAKYPSSYITNNTKTSSKIYEEISLRSDIFPISVPRKIKRYTPCTTDNNKRFITSAILIPTLPVKCITVEGGLFLISNNIITHNCNSSSAIIATTKGDITYGELHELLSKKQKVGIYTYDFSKNIVKSFLTYDIKSELNAVEQTYLVRTETGKVEIVNENHPFLTWGGKNKPVPYWKQLKDLKKGDLIATSTHLPLFGTHKLDKDYLEIIAIALTAYSLEANPQGKKDFIPKIVKYFNIGIIKKDKFKETLRSYLKNVIDSLSTELLGSLDKESLHTLLFYILKYGRMLMDETAFRENDGYNQTLCIKIRLEKFVGLIARQFLKFGITTDCVPQDKFKKQFWIYNTESIHVLLATFGYDIFKGEEFIRKKLCKKNKSLVSNGSTKENVLPRGIPHSCKGTNEPSKRGHKNILQKYHEENNTLTLQLYDWCTNEINWEYIGEITPYAIEQTIALEVADTHVIGNGIISHNSTMASIIALKEFYDLIILDNPHKQYGILSGSPIAILVMAQSQAQVKETIFAAIRGYANNSRYFTALQNKGEIEILSEEIRCYSKNVSIFAKHTNSKSLVGYTLKCMLLDEVARFETIGEEGKNKAFEIWENIGAGGSTFGHHFKKVAISSAWEPNDPIEILYNRAQRDPNTLAFKLTTFQVNLNLKKGVTPVIVSDYTNDFIKARREYEGIRFTKFNTFIDIENLDKAATCVSIIDAIPSQIDTKTNTGYKYYAGVDILRITPNTPEDSVSFIHVDPALKKDSAALAIARTVLVEDTWKIQIDALLKWEPHTDNKGLKRIVSFIDIEDKLKEIISKRRVGKVTFDQWNCLQEDSLILTKNGFKPLNTLQLHQEVISNKGVNKIVNLEKKENIPTLKITTEKGYVIEGTYNHPLLTTDNIFQELQNLNIGDKLRLNIPVVTTVNKQPSLYQEHEALVLGYLIAKGHWGDFKDNIRFSNLEEDVINDYKFSIKQLIRTQPHVYSRVSSNPNNPILKEVSVTNKKYYCKLTKDLDLQTEDFNKKIPNYIFTATKKEIGLLISGLFEGKGTIYIQEATLKKSARLFIELTTVSKKLSIQLQQLLLYLGIKSTRNKYYKKPYFEDNIIYYKVVISDYDLIHFKNAVGFRGYLKSNELEKAILLLNTNTVDNFNDRIISIKKTMSTIMHMEVSGDHTYCSEFINHNSQSLIQKLNAQGIDAQTASCSRENQFIYFTLFRDLLAHNYIVLPKDSLWSNNAITELSELVLRPNRQIIHPTAGKDLADAIVNAVYQCHQHMIQTGLTLNIGLSAENIPSVGLTPLAHINVTNSKTSKERLKLGTAIDRLYNTRARRI